MSASLRRIFQNSGWLLGGQLGAAALVFLQNVLVIRGLGADRYGTLALIVTFTAALGQLFGSRIWETLIRYLPLHTERGELRRASATLQACLAVEALTALLVAALVWGSAPAFADRLLHGTRTEVQLVRLFALYPIAIWCEEAASALLRLGDRFRWIAGQRIVLAALRLATLAVLALDGLDLREVLLLQIAAGAVGALALGLAARGVCGTLGLVGLGWARPGELWREAREVFGFTVFSNLTATSRLITSKADVLVIGWFATPAAAGFYELARRLTGHLIELARPLYESIYPELSKLVAAGRSGELAALTRQLTRRIALTIVPLCLGVDLLAGWFVRDVYGAAFDPSVLLLRILVWQAIWLPWVWTPGYLLATGRARLAAGINWIDALLYLVFLLAMVARYDAVGAAAATVLRCLVWVAMVLYALRISADAPAREGGQRT